MVPGLAFDGRNSRELSELLRRCRHERDVAVFRKHEQQILIGQQEELSVPVASALPFALAVLGVDASQNAAIEANRVRIEKAG